MKEDQKCINCTKGRCTSCTEGDFLNKLTQSCDKVCPTLHLKNSAIHECVKVSGSIDMEGKIHQVTKRVSHKTDLVLTYKGTLEDFKNITAIWNITKKNSNTSVSYTFKDTSLYGNRTIVIARGKLSSASKYRIDLTLYDRYLRKMLFNDTLNITTAIETKVGVFKITPSSGKFLTTKF